MSEFTPIQSSQEHVDSHELIHDNELAHLAAFVVEAAMRDDLVEVAKAHLERTGVENPNSYAPNKLRVGSEADKEIPEYTNSVYRSVSEEGIADLGATGIVRGAKTAGKSAKTNGHTTYWNQGEDGKKATVGQGFLIEAPLEAVQNGWVTADSVTSIYARDNDGEVKNILPK
jgi:hypothetical protein